MSIIYTVVHKTACQFSFLNSCVQHWPILIIFGLQHQEETWRKRMHFWPPHFNTVVTLPCEMPVVEPAVCEWCQLLPLTFALEEDILCTCCQWRSQKFQLMGASSPFFSPLLFPFVPSLPALPLLPPSLPVPSPFLPLEVGPLKSS